MVKGKRFGLVYSRKPPFDTREYFRPETIYTNNFECIVRVLFQREIEQARQRVKLTRFGYQYTPSKEYLHALNKFHSKTQTHNGTQIKYTTG